MTEAQGSGERGLAIDAAPSPGAARLVTLGLAAGVAGFLASAIVMLVAGRGWSLDLRVYLAAGRAFLDGRAVYELRFTSSRLPFSYPPFALAALSPLSLLPTGFVEVLWWLVDAGALVSTLWIATRELAIDRRARLAVVVGIAGLSLVALEPVRSNTDYAQINVLLMAMVVADALAVRGRGRGLLVGIASAVKLTPLYFVVLFAVGGDRRAVRNAIGTFAILTGVTWLFMPAASDRYFLHELRDPNQFGGLGAVSNQSLAGILHRSPFDGFGGVDVLWLGLCLATTVVVVVLARRLAARSALQALVVVGIGALLVSPLSWSHHWCWLVLVPITAWQLRGHRAIVALQITLLVVAAIAPYWLFRHGASRSIASCLLVVVALALLVTWLAVELKERDPVPATASATTDGAAAP